jgi:DNA-binding HxlR family transcriptional regulator
MITPSGREAAVTASRVLAAGETDTLLKKWSVPVLAELTEERRFSELRNALPGISPRALARALRDLEAVGLVGREVRPTHPPSTVYRATRRVL